MSIVLLKFVENATTYLVNKYGKSFWSTWTTVIFLPKYQFPAKQKL